MKKTNTPSLCVLKQKGVVLMVVLVGLVIMSFASVALMRVMEFSNLLSGNLALKRDALNQADRGVQQAITTLAAMSITELGASATGKNYSAQILTSDNKGVPTVLYAADATFATVGSTALDISDATTSSRIRYIIDRQCNNVGNLTEAECVRVVTVDASNQGTDIGAGGGGAISGSSSNTKQAYRVSVRVSLPKGVLTFVQSVLY